MVLPRLSWQEGKGVGLSTDRFSLYLLMLSEHLQSSTTVHEL